MSADPKAQFDTTPSRVVKGLAAGSLAGGLCVTVGIALSLLASKGFAALPILGAQISILFLSACIAWAAGLVVLAGVPWLVLHRLGFRSWRTATTLGGTLVFLVVFGLAAGGNVDDRNAFWTLLTLTLLGSLVGFVVWRTAYRPAPETPADTPQ